MLAVTVPLQLCTKLRIWKFTREKLKPPPAAALRVNRAEASFSNRKQVAVALIVPPPSQQQQQKPVPKGLLNKALVSIKERSIVLVNKRTHPNIFSQVDRPALFFASMLVLAALMPALLSMAFLDDVTMNTPAGAAVCVAGIFGAAPALIAAYATAVYGRNADMRRFVLRELVLDFLEGFKIRWGG